MLGPTDSTATLDASDAGGIWEHGSHGVEGTESPTLSPQVAVDSSMAMSLLSLDQGDKVGVLAMSTVASSSSQPHPELEGQTVTPGTLGTLAPSHDSSPQGEPVFPSWTPTAVSVDKPASVSSGEPTVPGDSPSTPPPASLGPEEFELEVLAGSPGVEGFWEEAASGEEPTLPGTPANGSAEEGEFKACDLIQPTVVRAWGQGAGERSAGREGYSRGPPGRFLTGDDVGGGSSLGRVELRKVCSWKRHQLGKGQEVKLDLCFDAQ